MDQSLIFTLIGLAINAVVAVVVTISFFRLYATKEDIEDLKGDINDLNPRLASVEARLGNVEAGQAALETRQAALEARIDGLDGSIREIGKKADASLDLHHTVRGDLKVLQASVDRLESYFETPKLKSS